MREKECLVCRRKFQFDRSSARFCSDACRQEFHRLRSRAKQLKLGAGPDARNWAASELEKHIQDLNRDLAVLFEVKGVLAAGSHADPALDRLYEQLVVLQGRLSAAALSAQQMIYDVRVHKMMVRAGVRLRD